MRYVLGAPGSGKTSLVPYLRQLLPGHVALDWDALMVPAGALTGTDIREDEAAWVPYAALIRQVVELAGPDRIIMLGVCTPDQLTDWPNGVWLLLDCSDRERARRLRERGETEATIAAALADAAASVCRGWTQLDYPQRRRPRLSQPWATNEGQESGACEMAIPPTYVSRSEGELDPTVGGVDVASVPAFAVGIGAGGQHARG